jgi:hypothetical protein
MCAFTAPEDFIARNSVHKVLIVICHIPQVTQVMNFFETKPKTIIDIGCDHLASSMTIIFSIHALHLRGL